MERKTLLEPIVADIPGLQFNGHETGDGELVRRHACQLGFEGIVSKTVDAPYTSGNRGLWRKAKCLNRQEFVVVGWTDPEGSRPHLGALLLGYYTDDGKLIYAGRVGTGMSEKVLRDLRRRLDPLARPKSPLSAPPPRWHALRLAARAVPRPLGRAEARGRDHVSDLDRRQPVAADGLCRAARGQTGRAGAARMSKALGPRMTSANMRANGVRSVIATCETCRHGADVDLDDCPRLCEANANRRGGPEL